MNLKLVQFEQELANVVNNNNFPIEVKRLVVKDLLSKIEIVTQQEVNKEAIERNKNETEQKENDEVKEGEDNGNSK